MHYNFIARGGAGVYPMRIVHHICVLDKPRNIRYIKWKSGQEVLDILGIHLAEDLFSTERLRGKPELLYLKPESVSDELQLAGPYCRINPNRLFRTIS